MNVRIRAMGRVLSIRTAHRLAWAVGGVSIVLAAVGLALGAVNWSTPLPTGMDDQAGRFALLLAFLPFSLVGALVLYRRPEHRIGWMFSVMGLSFLLSGAAGQYAIYGLITRPGRLGAA